MQENEKFFQFAMVKVKGSVGGKFACEHFGINTYACRSPSYQINIDKNLPKNFSGVDQIVGGKDKLQFHAMNNDASLMIERLSYSIMHHYLNISTARAVHCVLFVNSKKLGVFLNVEELDEKSIGPILFGEKGTMYKDVWPTDDLVWAPGGEELDLMEELRNESLKCVSQDRLQMNCTPEEGKMMLKKYIDTDSYMKVMLANNLLNNFDGTPKSLHNHYWFQNKNKGPYIFVPWDYNNLILSKLCKVNPDTGLIQGFGDIRRNSSMFIFLDALEPALNGVCDAPPFQYFPSPEERELLCSCPSYFNGHMTCLGAFSMVLSQSLVDDYFNHRNDAFQGKENDVKSEVNSMVEYWSDQIRTHINTSSTKYPMEYLWEERLTEIPLLFDYALDQLMNRKKDLDPQDIEAYFELVKNGKTAFGKEKCGCVSNEDCKYDGCTEGICQSNACQSFILMHDDCKGNIGLKANSDFSWCVDENKLKECPPKTGKSEVSSTSESNDIFATSESTAESTAESKAKSEVSSSSESKHIFATSESTAESKGKNEVSSTSKSKNLFSKTFGIATILILLLFTL